MEEEKLDQLRTARYIFFIAKGGGGEVGSRIFNGLIALPPPLIGGQFSSLLPLDTI